MTTLPGGWLRYQGWAASPDIPIPPTSWIVDPTPADHAAGPIAVFDAPNGNLIGYVYQIGYVPAPLVPSFDFAGASQRMWGCDIRDAACKGQVMAEQREPNISPTQIFPDPK